MNYKVEEYQILSVKTYRLLEEETGEYWYPLSLFLKHILFQQNGATKYRDNPKYNKFMKVISYINPRSLAPNMPNKTWCMNTEGIYLLLQNITINKTTYNCHYYACSCNRDWIIKIIDSKSQSTPS